MTTVPITTCNPFAYDHAAAKATVTYQCVSANQHRFNALFTKVFDRVRVQQLLAQSDLSSMLHTIAIITATK